MKVFPDNFHERLPFMKVLFKEKTKFSTSERKVSSVQSFFLATNMGKAVSSVSHASPRRSTRKKNLNRIYGSPFISKVNSSESRNKIRKSTPKKPTKPKQPVQKKRSRKSTHEVYNLHNFVPNRISNDVDPVVPLPVVVNPLLPPMDSGAHYWIHSQHEEHPFQLLFVYLLMIFRLHSLMMALMM